jgi:tetratricopeptide (TPR) repeat protein
VEKRQLIDLLNHYKSSSPEEAEDIISLRKQYPYSQVLQALSARVSKDHQLKNQQELLQTAAVYSTDRGVLKEIMAGAYTVAPQAPVTIAHTQKISEPVSTHDKVDYAEAVLEDLKRLHELKHNYEALIATLGIPDPEVEVKKPIKRSPGRPRKKENQEGLSEPLIDVIKTTKKKISPESSKTIEQIAIIDQFIKAQPNIKPRTEVQDQADLAEQESNDFGDTVISETLAEILIRQNKKEKAIEVLRKLIWKFPQKKAYFAAQIEELKK